MESVTSQLQAPETRDNASELLPGSPDLRRIAHPSLGPWLVFRRTLRPNYGRVWRDFALCLAMTLGGFAAHLGVTAAYGNGAGLAFVLPFALWTGFWLNAVLTFGHEAAHFNFAADRELNDSLADWTVWLFFPSSTKEYRRSHWQHHLNLGNPDDSEISYHNCLSPRFLAKALGGVHLLTLLVRYAAGRRPAPKPAAEARDASGGLFPRTKLQPLVRVAATHATLIGIALAFGCYATALMWTVAAAVVFPFLATVRQVLEHRAAQASCATDFSKVPHGPVNRLFGSDVFSRYFGAAGFNKHLLHHWDPTISYTRYSEMEAFLEETPAREELRVAQTTYFSAFAQIWKSSHEER